MAGAHKITPSNPRLSSLLAAHLFGVVAEHCRSEGIPHFARGFAFSGIGRRMIKHSAKWSSVRFTIP